MESGDDPARDVTDTTEPQQLSESRGWVAPSVPNADDNDGVKRILDPIHNPNPARFERIQRVQAR